MAVVNLSLQGVYNVNGLAAGATLGSLSVPNYGSNILVEVKAFQTGILGPINNLEVFVNDVSFGKILMRAVASQVDEFDCLYYADEATNIKIKSVGAAALTNYYAEISARIY